MTNGSRVSGATTLMGDLGAKNEIDEYGDVCDLSRFHSNREYLLS